MSRGLLPADAIVPHLRVVFWPLLALGVFRLVVAASETSAAAARITIAALAAALLALMISYYALVVIGLQSWGQIVSWDLIAAYGPQAPRLAEALGISPAVIAGAAALGYLALFAMAWVYLGYFDWPPLARRALRSPRFALVLCACGLVAAAELYGFIVHPDVGESEPVALTLAAAPARLGFPGASGRRAAGGAP